MSKICSILTSWMSHNRQVRFLKLNRYLFITNLMVIFCDENRKNSSNGLICFMKYMNYYFVLSLFLMGHSGDSYLPMLFGHSFICLFFINGSKYLHGSISVLTKFYSKATWLITPGNKYFVYKISQYSWLLWFTVVTPT